MLDPGQALETVDHATSDEFDLPDVSQLISSTQSQSQRVQAAMIKSDDELVPRRPEDLSSEEQSPANSSKKPDKSSYKHQKQSASKKPTSRVKTEDISQPLPASSPSSLNKVATASSDKPVKASSKKPKSVSYVTSDESDVLRIPFRKAVSKKRKHADPGSAVMTARAKVRRISEGEAGTSRGATNEEDDCLYSDVEEMASYTPKAKLKVKKNGNPPSASQPVRLPSSALHMMAPPSPPSSTQAQSKRALGNSTDASSPSASLTLPTKQNRALNKAVRSEDWWFLDGSVVLWVQRKLYKLHRSSLMKRSKYLQRLFGNTLHIPGPTDESGEDEEKGNEYGDPDVVEVARKSSDGLVEGELVDRCPVYRVTVVSTEDFEALLNAWEDGFAFAHSPPPFLALACLLRGAHALDCERIWEYASRVFTAMWPEDLSELSTSTDEQQKYAKEVLQSARECGLPSVRKRAYYELVCTPGFGQIATDDNAECVDDGELQPGANALRYADLLRLVATRERLERAWCAVARAPPAPSVVLCPLQSIPPDNLTPEQKIAIEKCQEARKQSGKWWTEQVVQAPLFQRGLLDPLSGLQELINIGWQELGFCAGCDGARKEFWEEEKKKLWGKLDIWLGLAMPAEEKKKDKKSK